MIKNNLILVKIFLCILNLCHQNLIFLKFSNFIIKFLKFLEFLEFLKFLNFLNFLMPFNRYYSNNNSYLESYHFIAIFNFYFHLNE